MTHSGGGWLLLIAVTQPNVSSCGIALTVSWSAYFGHVLTFMAIFAYCDCGQPEKVYLNDFDPKALA